MIKKSTVFLTAFLLPACAHLVDSEEKPQLYEEKFVGEHALLASCVADKLQSDSRWAMRLLQFRSRKYSDVEASEIHAFDTRYLPNLTASYSPTNPDAVLICTGQNIEILPYAQRNIKEESAHIFALMLKKIDDATVNATLRGDPYVGEMAWKILQSCATTSINLH